MDPARDLEPLARGALAFQQAHHLLVVIGIGQPIGDTDAATAGFQG